MNIVECQGNQYTCIVRDVSGNVFTLGKDSADNFREKTTAWPVDYLGATFTGAAQAGAV